MNSYREDPTYTDSTYGDGEELDTDRAMITYYGLAVDAMQACKRSGKKFRDTNELHRWQRVEDKIESHKIELAWAENAIKWAEKKNCGQRGAIITFPVLCGYIGNENKYDAWLAKQDRGHSELNDMKTIRDL
jgi:hypothetical protein